jgi:hypothetical protein
MVTKIMVTTIAMIYDDDDDGGGGGGLIYKSIELANKYLD